MNYHLQPIDQLISNKDEENEEASTIIADIKETAFTLRSEQEIRLFIQNHQLALLEHKNFDSVCGKCDKVLHFIETHFYDFVNQKLQISDIGKEKLYNQYSNLINEMKCEMQSCLSEKLCINLQPIIEPENGKHCTIYSARYISQFWKNWNSDFKPFSNALEEETIVSYLISQNFNQPTFFKYITSEITGELHQEDDPYIQEHVLLSYAKRFSIIPAKIGEPFRPEYPHIKQLLEDWFNKELKQCRIKQKKYDPEQQSIIPKDGHKIETSLSVAQTAYLFRLFSKSGIITNKVQLDILHVLSEKFRSKKAEFITVGSLHNKYYNVEERTKQSVKELLKELLNQIE